VDRGREPLNHFRWTRRAWPAEGSDIKLSITGCEMASDFVKLPTSFV
jgi:hypothetical protein